jgi:hypothetical protein
MERKITKFIIVVSFFSVIYILIGAIYLLFNTEKFLAPLANTSNISTLLGLTLNYVSLTLGSFLGIGVVSGMVFYYLTREER